MSVVGYLPVALVKSWIQPINYVVGFDLYGNAYTPRGFSFFQNNVFPSTMIFTALFPYPVVSVNAFSVYAGQYSQPLVITLDYPTMFVQLQINISP